MLKPTSSEDRVDVLIGEVHALVCFATALAMIHPDRARLRAHFEVSSQAGLASLETKPLSDRTIVGFQFVAERLLQVLASREEID